MVKLEQEKELFKYNLECKQKAIDELNEFYNVGEWEDKQNCDQKCRELKKVYPKSVTLKFLRDKLKKIIECNENKVDESEEPINITSKIREKREQLLEDKPNIKGTFQQLQFEVLQLIIDNKKDKATEEIVKFIKSQTPIKATRNDERNEIWVYKNGIFVPEGKTYIQETTRKILGNVYKTQFINNVIAKIEADSYIDESDFFNAQNNYPELICINNGILNIKTRKLELHSPKIPFFNKLSMNYEKGVNCDKFKKFIDELFVSEEHKKCVQELFGFCLYKKYKYKKAFMFEGGGDNGKTQLLKILTEKFIGLENSKEISLAQIEKDTYLVSELQNKLVNVSADITQNVLENTGVFKNLTGGDPVSCQRKWKTSLTIVSYAKMIFATNELPKIKDNSSGFWGRWELIEFPYKFLKQNEIDCLSDEEKLNCKVAVPDIIEKIIDSNELTGILNWALDGWDRLEKQKGFTTNNTRLSIQDTWTRKANSFLAFVKENVIEEYDSYIEKGTLKQYYLAYCRQHKVKIQDDKEIKNTLEEELGALTKQKWIDDEIKLNGLVPAKISIRVWDNIAFNQKINRVNRDNMVNAPIEKLSKNSLELKNPVKPVNPVKNNIKKDNNCIKKGSISSNKDFSFPDLIKVVEEKNDKKGTRLHEIVQKLKNKNFLVDENILLNKLKNNSEFFEQSPDFWKVY